MGKKKVVKKSVKKSGIKKRRTSKSNKPLRIAQMHWGFPPVIGGVETHLDILLPTFVKKGHKVSLLTGAMEGVRGKYKYKGVDIFRTPIMDLNWLYKRGFNALEKEIEKIFTDFIESVDPSVIHVHNMHYFSLIHAKLLEELSMKKGVPLVLTAHNVWDDNLYLDLIRKIKWSHVIAVSHFIKKEMIGVGFDDRKITVVHHGIDQHRYHPNAETKHIYKKYPMLKNKKVVFHPARMGLAKGCDVSIKALQIIKKRFPDIMLVLAGTKNIIDWGETQQKDIAYMVNLIDFFKLRDNILIDAFPLADMPGLYGVSDVCIYPSSSFEPFGLTMLEALSSQKPMVVTQTGGMPEIIKDGINGFVIPLKDFESLASRIMQIIDDKRLKERFGYTGRRMVEQYYTKELMTEHNINIYRELL